jgi:hypothetical protein
LAFIDTIGRMYYQQADHSNIAQKKIQYLLTFIRNRFGLNTNVLDNDFRKELAEKTDIDYAEITALFDEIIKAQKTPFLSDYSLLLLNQQIESFKEKTKR